MAVDELRDDEELSVEFLEGVNGADARVRQRGGRARFAPQTISMLRLTRQMGRQHLQRDRAPQARVRRQVDAAHPASTDLPDDRVCPEDQAGLERPFLFQQVRCSFGEWLGEKGTCA